MPINMPSHAPIHRALQLGDTRSSGFDTVNYESRWATLTFPVR